jgi:hypothetical protein
MKKSASWIHEEHSILNGANIMQTETMGIDPSYVAPKKDRIEGLVAGWVDNHEHRDEILGEIKRLWDIEQAPGREWLRQVQQAIMRRMPFWLYRFLLKVQLFLYAVANPRGERA